MKTIYLDLDSESRVIGWGTSSLTPDSIEVELEEEHGLLKYHGTYRYLDNAVVEDTAFQLEETKKAKFAELTAACQKAIFGYFDATYRGEVFTFSYDTEAQANFTGTLALFNAGLITGMEWTAHKDGQAHRLPLAYADFLPILNSAFQHKGSKVTRLRNELEPILKAATSIEEVMAILW